jgi:hypothetical protein
MLMSCLLCLALAAAPVQAGEIVVTGKAQTPEEERNEIRDYIRKTGIAKGTVPAARWTDRVCPKVYGVPPAIAERVVLRVRAVATAADIKLAKPDCDPNIAITFVDDGAGFARTMQKKSRRHLADVTIREKEELFKTDAPIRWWYATVEGSSEAPGSGDGGIAATGAGGGEGGQSVLAGVAGSADGRGNIPPSLISTRSARSIATATVVIDVNRAQGTSLDAVADYAAFVALAEIDPPKEAPQQSILTLFAGGAEGLTERDRDFLTALYKIPLDRQAYQQRGLMTGKLVKAAQD